MKGTAVNQRCFAAWQTVHFLPFSVEADYDNDNDTHSTKVIQQM